MKFGRKFGNHIEKTLPGWRGKYLRYKLLKKVLNNISPPAGVWPARPPLPDFQVWFVVILTGEIEKFNDFYVGEEEDRIIRFQALKEEIKRVKDRYYGMFISESEFSECVGKICKDLVLIHGEMVLLKSYSSLNFAGLMKILKKYDKRTGAMLSIPFTELASHQPFFKTGPLTRLVQDCEANLKVLLPRGAAVVDERTGINASLETLLLMEETWDVYRSTIATISTIEELKRPSSTSNSLSVSNLFRGRDDDGTSAVSAENSPCGSSVSGDGIEDEDEDEDEDVSSLQ